MGKKKPLFGVNNYVKTTKKRQVDIRKICQKMRKEHIKNIVVKDGKYDMYIKNEQGGFL